MILHADDSPRSDWSEFVQAELPDERLHPVLFNLISKDQQHGPCDKQPGNYGSDAIPVDGLYPFETTSSWFSSDAIALVATSP